MLDKKILNIKLKHILFFFLFFLTFLLISNKEVFADSFGKGFEGAVQRFFKEYKIHISAFLAIGVLTGIFAFIYLLCKLSFYADRPIFRFMIIKELIIVGVTTALLGIVPLIYILIITSTAG